MSQHSFNIANNDGASFRADLNLALEALVTLSAGSLAPSPTYPNMLWYDVSVNYIKKRNQANTAWQRLCSISGNGEVSFKAPALDVAAVHIENTAGVNVHTLKSDASNNGKYTLRDSAGVPKVEAEVVSGKGFIRLNGLALPLQYKFESAQLTVPSSGRVDVDHGLGAVPSLISASLRCITAEQGWSNGNEVSYFGNILDEGTNTTQDAIGVWCGSLNIGVSYSRLPYLPNKDTGAAFVPTTGNWRWVLRAWS